MKSLLLLFCILFPLLANCQIENGNVIKFKVQVDKSEPLAGATIYDRTSGSTASITTDINGEAE